MGDFLLRSSEGVNDNLFTANIEQNIETLSLQSSERLASTLQRLTQTAAEASA